LIEFRIVSYSSGMSIEIVFAPVLEKVAKAYFNLFEKILRDLTGISLRGAIEFDDKKPLDERIAKIDEARTNLQEALAALQELADEAQRNKGELAEAIGKLQDAKEAHASEKMQLEQIKVIAQSDIDAFRRMAGINSPFKERIFGFFAGIVASLVAAGICQAIYWIVKK
jgi:hypothetical protein